jgi:DNA polymerase III alpha subunit
MPAPSTRSPELHRAQYICVPDGETQNGLEKMIKFGQIVQAQSINTTNTLFGDLPAVLDIKPPVIPNCPPWSLTEQLEKEKEVAGIYLSGHPLDHYKFEMRHYRHYADHRLQRNKGLEDACFAGANIQAALSCDQCAATHLAAG